MIMRIPDTVIDTEKRDNLFYDKMENLFECLAFLLIMVILLIDT